MTFQKPHYPSPRTKLASLVKGRWIDGKTQTVALLRFTCDIPTLFMLQTLLPSRRRDCHSTTLSQNLTIPRLTLNLPPLSKVRCCRPKKNSGDYRRDCHSTTPPQNRTTHRKAPPHLPPLEKGEVARLIQFFGLLYSIQIVLPLRF